MNIAINRGSVAQTGTIPVGARFIQDTYPLKILESKKTVSESNKDRPVLRVTGIFQKADERNQNGRVYPYDVLSEAVKVIQEDIDKRSIMGEFDHPADAKIHLDRVSHVITKIWMEGKYVYGVAEVLEDMPCGNMLASLLRSKVQVGISSRGVGDMEAVNEGMEDETHKVLPGYAFVTWDIVGEPSVGEAVVKIMEGRNKVMTRSKKVLLDPKKALVTEISKWLKQD